MQVRFVDRHHQDYIELDDTKKVGVTELCLGFLEYSCDAISVLVLCIRSFRSVSTYLSCTS